MAAGRQGRVFIEGVFRRLVPGVSVNGIFERGFPVPRGAQVSRSGSWKRGLMERWFFLDDGALAGARNMAVDEFLLDRSHDRGGVPVLRLYSFGPPAVTLGYHQDARKVIDIEAVRRDGIDLVRRITGGRALLHEGELTYSVTAALDSVFFAGCLHKTFTSISTALVTALRVLGVDAVISDGKLFKGAKEMTSPCLVSTSRHEITVGGRKIVGSAQRRTGSAFLQHGSILLTPASERIAEYMPGQWTSLRGHVTSVSSETGGECVRNDAVNALREAFEQIFNTELRPFRFSDSDLDTIEERTAEKAREFSSLVSGEVDL